MSAMAGIYIAMDRSSLNIDNPAIWKRFKDCLNGRVYGTVPREDGGQNMRRASDDRIDGSRSFPRQKVQRR